MRPGEITQRGNGPPAGKCIARWHPPTRARKNPVSLQRRTHMKLWRNNTTMNSSFCEPVAAHGRCSNDPLATAAANGNARVFAKCGHAKTGNLQIALTWNRRQLTRVLWSRRRLRGSRVSVVASGRAAADELTCGTTTSHGYATRSPDDPKTLLLSPSGVKAMLGMLGFCKHLFEKFIAHQNG